MLRAILLLIVMILAGKLLSRLLRGIGRPAPGTNERSVAHMVRCARCATFIPATDAVSDGALHYCCDDHRRQGPAPGT